MATEGRISQLTVRVLASDPVPEARLSQLTVRVAAQYVAPVATNNQNVCQQYFLGQIMREYALLTIVVSALAMVFGAALVDNITELLKPLWTILG